MTKAMGQQAFDAVFKASKSLGYDTYPMLPMSEVAYPFVVIGEVQELPRYSTYRLYGKFFVTVDVWGAYDMRKKVSAMCEAILLGCHHLTAGTRQLALNLNATSQRILADHSTSSPLWHGVIHLEFNLI